MVVIRLVLSCCWQDLLAIIGLIYCKVGVLMLIGSVGLVRSGRQELRWVLIELRRFLRILFLFDETFQRKRINNMFLLL